MSEPRETVWDGVFNNGKRLFIRHMGGVICPSVAIICKEFDCVTHYMPEAWQYSDVSFSDYAEMAREFFPEGKNFAVLYGGRPVCGLVAAS